MALPSWLEGLSSRRKTVLYVFIPLLSLLMHSYVFNRDLVGFHVWRQTQTQINIENFAKEDFNILDPRIDNRGAGSGIFRMEFPIMQWLFAIFYKLFGTHIFISRILTFIIGLFSVWGIYHLLYALFNRIPIALIGAWCFNFSPVFYYYTVNPLPDNFALCLSIWGLTFFFRWIKNNKTSSLVLSAALLSLATMAKLPFVIYLSVIGVYIIWGLVRKAIKVKTVLKIVVVYGACFLPAAAWYFSVVGGWQGNGIVAGITAVKKDDIANILGIMQANLVSSLPELLVNYGALLFFLAGFYFMFRNKVQKKEPGFIMLVALGTSAILYFLFEMNMIGRVHDYYLFPFLTPIFILLAYGAEQLFMTEKKLLKTFCTFLICILPLTAFLRIEHRWNTTSPGFNPDLYTYKNDLRSAVPDNALCIVGNDESGHILFYYIHKKGWCFDLDTLGPKSIKALIAQGAKYLYTDSRKVDENKEVQPYFDRLIMQRGSIKVYALKDQNTIAK